MDGSATRRGVRTTHLVFADRHQQGDWIGEARRFGEGVAILVGDLAFAYADTLMRGVPDEAWCIWNELRIELNIGQYLDILGTARGERGRATVERISRYKSGKYTVERPLQLGAVLAAPERPELLPALSAYACRRRRFQLRDDVLAGQLRRSPANRRRRSSRRASPTSPAPPGGPTPNRPPCSPGRRSTQRRLEVVAIQRALQTGASTIEIQIERYRRRHRRADDMPATTGLQGLAELAQFGLARALAHSRATGGGARAVLRHQFSPRTGFPATGSANRPCRGDFPNLLRETPPGASRRR
jgi:hypothetical protein